MNTGFAVSNFAKLGIFVCCVVSGLCDEPITRPEESCQVHVSVCDLETQKKRGSLDPILVVAPQNGDRDSL